MTESFKKKIPDNMHPWECEVNGVKYVYPAGTEQDVPEEVAVIIDAYWASRETEFPNTAISFNELRDRPFGEDTAVLFDQSVEFTTDNELQHIVNGVFPIESGDTVKVTWGGVEYECDAVAVADGEYTLVMIGNVYGEGTEPFVIIVVPPEGITIISSTHMEGEIDVKIEKSVVHKLDPKFLPGGGGGGCMLVKITRDENYNFTPDKEYNDVINAIKSGSVVQFVMVRTEDPNYLSYIRACEVSLGEYGWISLTDHFNEEWFVWSSSEFRIDGGDA